MSTVVQDDVFYQEKNPSQTNRMFSMNQVQKCLTFTPLKPLSSNLWLRKPTFRNIIIFQSQTLSLNRNTNCWASEQAYDKLSTMQPLVILEPVTIQAVSHHLSLHNLKKLVSYKLLLETHPTRKFPALAVYNHRHIWKKLKNFCVEFHEMRMGITFHSEVWRQKDRNKWLNQC